MARRQFTLHLCLLLHKKPGPSCPCQLVLRLRELPPAHHLTAAIHPLHSLPPNVVAAQTVFARD